MNDEYEFSSATQFNILCAYVREPKRFGAIVEPHRFQAPIYLDIARIVGEARDKHPNDALSESTLTALVQQEFPERKHAERSKLCRRAVHKIFKHRLHDLDTLEDIARKWVVARRYRQWLVDSEEHINQGDYASLPKLLARTQTSLGLSQSSVFHTADDFEQSHELSFSIEGFLQNGAATMIGALAGHGKTWVMMSMAKALLSGKPLWGHFKVPKKAKRVLYLIPESTVVPFKHRLKRMQLYKYVKDGRLLVHTMSAGPKPKLDDPQILAVAKRSHIFLDTAVRFGEGSENDSRDNQQGLATDIFTLLAAGAKTVTGAHHSPKGFEKERFMTLENVLRGTGDIGAVPATVWGIKQLDSTRNIIHIENVKARDFIEPPCKPFQIIGRPYIDSTGDFRMMKKPGTCGSLVAEQPQRGGAAQEDRDTKNKNLEAIRAIYRKHPKWKSKDIAQKLGVAEATVRGYKRQIRAEG